MELKRLADLFWRVSPNLFFLSIIFGVATGLCYSLLIPFVMYAVASQRSGSSGLEIENLSFFNSPTAELGSFFLLACGLIVAVKSVSLVLSLYIASKASMAHRLSLYQRIRKLSYRDLEVIGQARVINLINIDIPSITAAAVSLPSIWVCFVTIIGTLGYLIYLDIKVFWFVLGALSVGVLTYQLPVLLAGRFFSASREHFDQIQEGVKGLIYGAKELKLNDEKAQAYYQQDLLQPERGAFKGVFHGSTILIVAENYGEIISFLVIAVAIFHLPYVFDISQLQLFGIVMALLYLTGPVSEILHAMSGIQKGKVSLAKLQQFYRQLNVEQGDSRLSIPKDFKQYRVEGLSYRYGEGDDSFAVENVNLTFKRGQISYITGGNGSGKSTLSKCLTLHYWPSSGNVAFDELAIDRDSMFSARRCISAIYSDYHLFERLYHQIDDKQSIKIERYLGYLELSEKVRIDGDRFSTVHLSDGQRKRLALLVLLLEDRPVLLFDEWASDQDPRFKDIFYRVILPDLRAAGKAVIVISHDDRYFELADQLIVMENGRVKSVCDNNIVQQTGINATEEPLAALV